MLCQFCREFFQGDYVAYQWKRWHRDCYDKMLFQRPSTPLKVRAAIRQRLHIEVIEEATGDNVAIEVISFQEGIAFLSADFSVETEGDSSFLM